MHPMHPAIAGDMIQARRADQARLARGPGARRSKSSVPASRFPRRGRHAARRAAGWWLVNLGFRLALPRYPAVGSITSVAR